MRRTTLTIPAQLDPRRLRAIEVPGVSNGRPQKRPNIPVNLLDVVTVVIYPLMQEVAHGDPAHSRMSTGAIQVARPEGVDQHETGRSLPAELFEKLGYRTIAIVP